MSMSIRFGGSMDSPNKKVIKIRSGGNDIYETIGGEKLSELLVVATKWRSFTEHFKLTDQRYTKELNSRLCEIFCVNISYNPEQWLIVLNSLLLLEEGDFNTLVYNIVCCDMHGTLTTLSRAIYTNIRILFEKMFMSFIEKRNNFVLEDEKNNIDSIYREWKRVDSEMNISSSSVLLLFSNLPPSPSSLPWMKNTNMPWPDDIPKLKISSSKYKEFKNLEDKYKMFTYYGFCPKAPRFRMIELLKFPLVELDACAKIVGSYVPDYKQIYMEASRINKTLSPIVKYKKQNVMDLVDANTKRLAEEKTGENIPNDIDTKIDHVMKKLMIRMDGVDVSNTHIAAAIEFNNVISNILQMM